MAHNIKDKVRIVRVRNKRRAIHLLKYITGEGEIIEYTVSDKGIKYKVLLDNNEIKKFYEDEIELIEANE